MLAGIISVEDVALDLLCLNHVLIYIQSESLHITTTPLALNLHRSSGNILDAVILSSIHPEPDLCTLQQGQATEELLLSVVSLAGLQGRGGQTGTRTGVPGNQQLEPARPITRLHVAPSKSPINWSDCPVDWKRELCVSPSLTRFSSRSGCCS